MKKTYVSKEKQFINGKKRNIYTGPKGGKYIMKGGKKLYVKMKGGNTSFINIKTGEQIQDDILDDRVTTSSHSSYILRKLGEIDVINTNNIKKKLTEKQILSYKELIKTRKLYVKKNYKKEDIQYFYSKIFNNSNMPSIFQESPIDDNLNLTKQSLLPMVNDGTLNLTHESNFISELFSDKKDSEYKNIVKQYPEFKYANISSNFGLRAFYNNVRKFTPRKRREMFLLKKRNLRFNPPDEGQLLKLNNHTVVQVSNNPLLFYYCTKCKQTKYFTDFKQIDCTLNLTEESNLAKGVTMKTLKTSYEASKEKREEFRIVVICHGALIANTIDIPENITVTTIQSHDDGTGLNYSKRIILDVLLSNNLNTKVFKEILRQTKHSKVNYMRKEIVNRTSTMQDITLNFTPIGQIESGIYFKDGDGNSKFLLLKNVSFGFFSRTSSKMNLSDFLMKLNKMLDTTKNKGKIKIIVSSCRKYLTGTLNEQQLYRMESKQRRNNVNQQRELIESNFILELFSDKIYSEYKNIVKQYPEFKYANISSNFGLRAFYNNVRKFTPRKRREMFLLKKRNLRFNPPDKGQLLKLNNHTVVQVSNNPLLFYYCTKCKQTKYFTDFKQIDCINKIE